MSIRVPFLVLLACLCAACWKAHSSGMPPAEVAAGIDSLEVVPAFISPHSQATFEEPFRPQVHLSPGIGSWHMPSGFVYYGGEYHVFFAANLEGDTEKATEWEHVASHDLIRWRYLPTALQSEDAPFLSGSVVADTAHSSGLGNDSTAALVAIYSQEIASDTFAQRLAFSVDQGQTWQSPDTLVLQSTADMSRLRDPRVSWQADLNLWRMALAGAEGIHFFESQDLRSWKATGTFGKEIKGTEAWYCPDLRLFTTREGLKKWGLLVHESSANDKSKDGTRYFLGKWRRGTFVADPAFMQEAHWLDYGRDFSATALLSGLPPKDGRHVCIAGMQHPDYAQNLPTDGWQGGMSLPRMLLLKRTDKGWRLGVEPVVETRILRQEKGHVIRKPRRIAPEWNLPEMPELPISCELTLTWAQPAPSEIGLHFENTRGEQLIMAYRPADSTFYVDRRAAGVQRAGIREKGPHVAPCYIANDTLRLQVMLDWSSVEVFAGEGQATFTERVFPQKPWTEATLYAQNGQAKLVAGTLWPLRRLWKQKE